MTVYTRTVVKSKRKISQDFVAFSEYMNFTSFLSGGFTTMAVMNPPEKKLEKRTSVQYAGMPVQQKCLNTTITKQLVLSVGLLFFDWLKEK